MLHSVKVCGIVTLGDARYAAAAGADLLGFVQVLVSPRYIEPSRAKAIIDWIHGPKSVGVFADAPLSHVNAVAARVGFDYVQLHGSESAGFCRHVAQPVIKAFSVKADTTVDALRDRMERYRGAVSMFLLDTHDSILLGGTGRTLPWEVAASVAREFPVMLAGGLGPHNVRQAMEAVRPYGIDCSSRLESAPGRKDPELVSQLMEAVEMLRP